MLIRLVCHMIKLRGTSRHVLARYKACKAWGDIKRVENRAEVGRGERKPLFINLHTIDKSKSTHRKPVSSEVNTLLTVLLDM